MVGPLFFLCVSKLPIIATRRFAAPTGLPERKERRGLGNLSLVLFCWVSVLSLLFLYITILWFLEILSLPLQFVFRNSLEGMFLDCFISLISLLLVDFFCVCWSIWSLWESESVQ